MAKSAELSVLIVHAAGAEYWADEIADGLRTALGITGITLFSYLTNGQPLNLKDMVDRSSVVIFIDDSQVFRDTITYTVIFYAKNNNKAIPVAIGDPSIRCMVEFSNSTLRYEKKYDSSFWSRLRERITNLAS